MSLEEVLRTRPTKHARFKGNLVGKHFYFNAKYLGCNGYLSGIVTKDGDVSNEYSGYIMMKGIYNNSREVWVSKGILKDKTTKELFDTPI